MKSRKNTSKRGGGKEWAANIEAQEEFDSGLTVTATHKDNPITAGSWAPKKTKVFRERANVFTNGDEAAKQMDTMHVHDNEIYINDDVAETWWIDERMLNERDVQEMNTIIGGTKRMSRKSRKGKKTKKGRGGTGFATYQVSDGVAVPYFVDKVFLKNLNEGKSSFINKLDRRLILDKVAVNEGAFGIEGGSKRKSRKSRKAKKTKKGRVAYEGGKKKCPKHCRRKTRRSRKRLKHRKN